VRIELDSFDVRVDGTAVGSSTTIGSVGAYLVVVATAIPDLVIGVTSCYLGGLGEKVMASHLRLGPGRFEQLRAERLAHSPFVAERARFCLLDHAAELQRALVDLTASDIRVDIKDAALARAAEAWGDPDSSV
jgi:hypothetical protein